VSLLALGRTTDAIAELEAAVKLDPASVPARVQLARAFVRAGQLEKAIEQYRRLRDAQPSEPEYHYQLARIYANLGAASFHAMSETVPQPARVQQLLGETYLAGGRLDQALEAFEAALRADPNLAGVHLNLAQIYLRRSDVPSARRELDRELAVVPGSAVAAALKNKLESLGNPGK
jgi:predicted Zn-dependent protease